MRRAAIRAAVAGLTAAGLGLGVVWNRFERVEVAGDSMLPTLAPGDRLLVVRTRRLRPGQLVVVPDPRRPSRALVKRVAAGPGTTALVGGRVVRAGPGQVLVGGDNPAASTDSRTFGAVALSAVQGRPLYRYAPSGRTGRL